MKMKPNMLKWRLFSYIKCNSFATVSSVKIKEVGPRDGLQNEKKFVDTETKIEMIKKLSSTGLKYIEATSFVNPKRIPQMADSSEIAKSLPSNSPITFAALIPNTAGFSKAVQHPAITEVAVFTSATEEFNKRNINCSIAESLDRFRPLMKLALEYKLPVRGYVSCVLGCPFEGPRTSPEKVLKVVEKLFEAGIYEVSLGDTIGTGTPSGMENLLNVLVKNGIDVHKLAVHCHNTYGQALANILIALQAGVETVDSSVAGLGGCPYAPGATGNIATEDLIYMLDGMNIKTGVNLDTMIEVGKWICKELGIKNNSFVSQAKK